MRILLAVALLLACKSSLACTKDTDCKGDRICVTEPSGIGQCRSPEPKVVDVKSVPESSSEEAAHQKGQGDSLRNFHLNLLGALQFGLTPSLEWGEDVTVILRARLLNSGVLSYLVAASDGGELVFGLGTSFQVRKYLGHGVQQGPYLGAGLELMYTQTEGDETWETYFLVPQVEGGFRWQSEGYFTGFGVFAGLAVPVKTVGYSDDESLITGGLIWDIGWYF